MKAIEDAVAIVKPLMIQAFMKGGTLGAGHVKSTLNR